MFRVATWHSINLPWRKSVDSIPSSVLPVTMSISAGVSRREVGRLDLRLPLSCGITGGPRFEHSGNSSGDTAKPKHCCSRNGPADLMLQIICPGLDAFIALVSISFPEVDPSSITGYGAKHHFRVCSPRLHFGSTFPELLSCTLYIKSSCCCLLSCSFGCH